MAKRSKICFLSGNMLKFIAAFTMVIDHLGFFIFKDVLIFRIIGRITFPIFSYLIAEGCRYTKNKIVYISCDPNTLARDAKIILASNKYKIKEIQPYDMFPQTKHVETLACFERL